MLSRFDDVDYVRARVVHVTKLDVDESVLTADDCPPYTSLMLAPRVSVRLQNERRIASNSSTERVPNRNEVG